MPEGIELDERLGRVWPGRIRALSNNLAAFQVVLLALCLSFARTDGEERRLETEMGEDSTC